MILSGKIGLRARQEADVPVLHAELYDDVAAYVRADFRPWRPLPPGSPQSPYAIGEPREDAAAFSVVERASQELAGEAVLWGIDTYSRTAHLGVALRPAFRGRGLGSEVVGALCEFGFAVRGLQRLQVETMAGNAPMLAAARKAGFTLEGMLRRHVWCYGAFSDVVVLGLLSEEWAPPPG